MEYTSGVKYCYDCPNHIKSACVDFLKKNNVDRLEEINGFAEVRFTYDMNDLNRTGRLNYITGEDIQKAFLDRVGFRKVTIVGVDVKHETSLMHLRTFLFKIYYRIDNPVYKHPGRKTKISKTIPRAGHRGIAYKAFRMLSNQNQKKE